MKEFILNSSIKVKLSQEGISILNERYSQYGCYKQPDSEGYFEFQLWEFMNVYGKYMSPGEVPFLETSILLKEKDLKEHEKSMQRRRK